MIDKNGNKVSEKYHILGETIPWLDWKRIVKNIDPTRLYEMVWMIDKNGEVVLPLMYDDIKILSWGKIVLSIEEWNDIMMNSDLEQVIDDDYYSTYDYILEDKLICSVDFNYGMVNTKEEILIDFIFDKFIWHKWGYLVYELFWELYL